MCDTMYRVSPVVCRTWINRASDVIFYFFLFFFEKKVKKGSKRVNERAKISFLVFFCFFLDRLIQVK